MKLYIAHIERDGMRVTQTDYVDWFEDDDDAREQYAEILREQGYRVKSVTIGQPCIVEIS